MKTPRPFYTALIAVLQSASTGIIILRAFILFHGFMTLVTGATPNLGWLVLTGLGFCVLGCPLLAVKNALLGVVPPTSAAAWCSTRLLIHRLGYAGRMGLNTVIVSLILVFYLDYEHSIELFKILSSDDFKRHVHLTFALGVVWGLILSRWRIKKRGSVIVSTPPLLEQSTE